MEKYSKAVSEMYSQFKRKEAHPLEKYVGRYVQVGGQKLEVIGYSKDISWDCGSGSGCFLIVDGASLNGWPWTALENQSDVVFKHCERYYYVDADNLID